MKVKVRQIVRAATGNARSLVVGAARAGTDGSASTEGLFRARLMAALGARIAMVLTSDADYKLGGRDSTKAPRSQRERAQRLLVEPGRLAQLEAAVPWAEWAAACASTSSRAARLAPLGPAHASLPAHIEIEMPRLAGEWLAEALIGANARYWQWGQTGLVEPKGEVAPELALEQVASDVASFLKGDNLDGAPPWQYWQACLDEAGLADAAAEFERALEHALPVFWDLIAPGRPRPRLRFGRIGWGMLYGRFCPAPTGPGVVGVHTRFLAIPRIIARHKALGEAAPCGCANAFGLSPNPIGDTLLHELIHAASCHTLPLAAVDPAVIAQLRAKKSKGERLVGFCEIGIIRAGITTHGQDYDDMRMVSPYQVVSDAPSSRMGRLSEGLTELVARGFADEARRLVPDPPLWELFDSGAKPMYEIETRLAARIVADPASVLWNEHPRAAFEELLVAAFGEERAAGIMAAGEPTQFEEDEFVTFERWLDERSAT